MSLLDCYGIGAVALIVPVFYFVREIRTYLALSAAIVGTFGAATVSRVHCGQCSEWVVMVVGLFLSVFGLLIVRVMLIRSVSLQLLAKIESGGQESIGEDIGRRLLDMRYFHLIHTTPDGKSALTGVGRFVAGVVATFYAIFRIGGKRACPSWGEVANGPLAHSRRLGPGMGAGRLSRSSLGRHRSARVYDLLGRSLSQLVRRP